MAGSAPGDPPGDGEPIALGAPTVGAAELDAVAEVLRSGWLAGAGPMCRRFEECFAELAGTRNALSTSNCGAALQLALSVLGVGPGEEVIVADYTFPATGHAVRHAGGIPVFADIRPDIWTVDPDAVRAAITPRTVGVVAVDVFGQPADYDELRALTDAEGLFLVEDAACAAGATYHGRKAGSLADIAAFSFHGRKNITAGEGGALTSDDDELLARARKLHTYGIEPALRREGAATLPIPSFDELGHNYRLSDIQAGIMLAQLERLDELLVVRRMIADRYSELLAGVDGVEVPVALDDREHPWQAYAVNLAPEISRDEVALRLRARGIGANFGTYASHLQPVYAAERECPVSADVFARQLAIPMHANL
ncbi:MAG: DegT/DnrJ/EryC1/StrS family aminotransferase, partial [Sciscionella sp.]